MVHPEPDRSGNDPAKVRVGDAERNAAMKALEHHLTEGRLDVDEYGERTARASLARHQDELRSLFLDLPLPHGMPDPRRTPAVAQPHLAGSAQLRRRSRGALGAPLFGQLGERIVALSPFIALALFFTVIHVWLVFLLIPLSGIVVYGNARGHKRRR